MIFRLLLDGAAGDDSAIESLLEVIGWQYPSGGNAICQARVGVTQLNREINDSIESENYSERLVEDDLKPAVSSDLTRKPAFMADEAMRASAAEKGVWTHRFIELLDLADDLTASGLAAQKQKMINEGHFTADQAKYVDTEAVAGLFESEAGRKMVANIDGVQREWEFTYAVAPSELLPGYEGNKDKKVIVRGIIDCLVFDGEGYEIIDFKTDDVSGDKLVERAKKYEFQLGFYKRAVEGITGKKVSGCKLYFLKPGVEVSIVN